MASADCILLASVEWGLGKGGCLPPMIVSDTYNETIKTSKAIITDTLKGQRPGRQQQLQKGVTSVVP